jgi:hypothetical protein
MKKTYEKPVIARKGKLSALTAANGASLINGAAPT